MQTHWRLWYVASLVLLVVTVPWLSSAGGQSPLRDNDKKGITRFPNNTTITIYIPPDPDNVAGRRDALIDGMKAWFNDPTLKDRGIKVDVTGTQPANSVKNVVKVFWEATGTLPGDERGDGGPATDGTTDASGNSTAQGGEIRIDRGVANNDEAFNLGAHEMGHVLGLAHDPNGNPTDIMFPVIRKDAKLELSSRNNGKAGDLAELKETYAANRDDSDVQLAADVREIDSVFRYQYTATLLRGGPLAVFQIDTHGASIFDIVPATGWMLDPFDRPDDLLDLRLVVGNETFLGFVHQQDDFDLSLDNPVLTFAFSSTAPPGPAEAFLNGRFETVGPVSTTPEPRSLSMVAIGLVALGIMRRARKSAEPDRRRHR